MVDDQRNDAEEQSEDFMEFTHPENMNAGNWMTPFPHTIEIGRTYREAAEIMEQRQLSVLPIIDSQRRPIGLVTLPQLLKVFVKSGEDTVIRNSVRPNDLMLIRPDSSVLELFSIPHKQFLVVDENKALIGIVTTRDILDAFSKYIYRLRQAENKMEVLKVILEKAYEGIAVVDENGILLEFNEAYSRFTGVKREDAIGRHVTEVIENTNLHMTVKTAIPDRGVLQTIQGQSMLVHRIPLWKGNKVVGAIGMLIFESVSEVYDILDRLQGDKVEERRQAKLITTEVAEDSRVTMNQIIGTSEPILNVKRKARKAARTAATILISGESGTGKEVFAKSIHHLSPYYNGPFISVNCGAIPEDLFESELFGYEEGAFTGAKKSGKLGKFELAQNGTIFLDEIGELSLLFQTKLLRVLQEREIERVGGVKKYSIDVRVIAATNRDIEKMVEEGTFREDLYYRLNIIRLHLPPLRERREDIPVLLDHFVKEACHKYGIQKKRFTSEVVSALMGYKWKGNIRELVNLIEQIVILSNKEVIELRDLPEWVHFVLPGEKQRHSPKLNEFKSKSADEEKRLILQVLESTGGNKTAAAKELGMHRTTLHQKLRKYGL